jgi:hypothetical protein
MSVRRENGWEHYDNMEIRNEGEGLLEQNVT